MLPPVFYVLSCVLVSKSPGAQLLAGSSPASGTNNFKWLADFG
jgi:hypothetical protein